MKCLVKEERRRTRAKVMLQIYMAVGQTLNQAWYCFPDNEGEWATQSSAWFTVSRR